MGINPSRTAAPDLASLAPELSLLSLTTYTSEDLDFRAVRGLPTSLRRVVLNPVPGGAIPTPILSLPGLEDLDLGCGCCSCHCPLPLLQTCCRFSPLLLLLGKS